MLYERHAGWGTSVKSAYSVGWTGCRVCYTCLRVVWESPKGSYARSFVHSVAVRQLRHSARWRFGGTVLKGGQHLSSRVSSETKNGMAHVWNPCIQKLRQGITIKLKATQISRSTWASLRLSTCLGFDCLLLPVPSPACLPTNVVLLPMRLSRG